MFVLVVCLGCVFFDLGFVWMFLFGLVLGWLWFVFLLVVGLGGWVDGLLFGCCFK